MIEQEPILQEADRIVEGDRREAHGHPLWEFTALGRMWGALLGIPDIDPRLVGLMLIDLKQAREAHGHRRDNLVDIAGYAKTIDILEEARTYAHLSNIPRDNFLRFVPPT